MSEAIFPLGTGHLELRFHTAEDAADLLRVYAQEPVARYLLEERWDEEYTQEQLAKRVVRTSLDEPPHALSLVIADRSGRYIGDLALWLTDIPHRQAEIGWVLDPQCAGLGYATEAAAALLKVAFTQLGVHRIAAEMDARNTASAALARRLGFRLEGHLHEHLYSKGEYTSTLVFGMLAGDLPPRDATTAQDRTGAADRGAPLESDARSGTTASEAPLAAESTSGP